MLLVRFGLGIRGTIAVAAGGRHNHMEINMLKRTLMISAVATLGFMAPATVSAADDTKAVEKEVLNRIKITPKKIESLALQKVFSATFYQVKIAIKQGGGTSTSTMSLALNQGKFVDLETNGTNQKMPVLLSVVKKDFKLKSESDAKVFQEALDKVYPIRGFGSDKDVKAIKKTDAGWTFIRGKFFKNLSGFIIKTDAAGSIKAIDFSLRIKK